MSHWTGLILFLACVGFRLCEVPVSAAEKQSANHSPGANPLSIHPENSKYFLFRGKPLVLIAATEHYGSVINRPFDFARYLAEAADKKQTLTRTFLLFRELQTPRNPASPCKPESPDYIAPFPRTGPGLAKDGEPRYDLDQWNPEFFDRMHRFLSLASKREVVVELTLFSNTYGTNIWELNPFYFTNNIQNAGQVRWSDYMSLNDPPLFQRQAAYARKVIQETCRYDNLYYEVCNEPGGGLTNHATVAEVDAWQQAMGRVMREELKRLGAKHLVFGSQAFSYRPKFEQRLDESFTNPLLDGVNVHPLPNTAFGGLTYDLGEFMGKQLKLSELRDFCAACRRELKPVVLDEDNAASLYRDTAGWTIHRKRAWVAVMSQAHYNMIDFSIRVGLETGTDESRRKLRAWMKDLSGFIHSLDFVHCEPMPGWLEDKPSNTLAVVLGKPAADYVAYLADAREHADPKAGQPITGAVSFSLPPGDYRVRFYSPISGKHFDFGSRRVSGGKVSQLTLPAFQHDLVLRATRIR